MGRNTGLVSNGIVPTAAKIRRISTWSRPLPSLEKRVEVAAE